jgi:CBS domain-containing protein
MLKLRDIMTRNVATLEPNSTLRDALALFSDQHITGAPVVQHNQLVGVISITDLLDVSILSPPVEEPRGDRLHVTTLPAAGSGAAVFDEVSVADVMTRYPIWKMPPDAPVVAAADCMRQHAVHRILVVDGESLVGIVTAWDIANAVAENKLTARTWVFEPERDFDDRGWWTEWLLNDR